VIVLQRDTKRHRATPGDTGRHRAAPGGTRRNQAAGRRLADPAMAGSGGRAPLYSRAMSDEANLDELARRYVELWQDQVSALAADPEFAEALGRLFNSMGLTGAPDDAPQADAADNGDAQDDGAQDDDAPDGGAQDGGAQDEKVAGGFSNAAAAAWNAWSAWPAMLSGMAAAMEGQAEDGATPGQTGGAGNATGKTTARPAATAAASEPGGARLAQLESRIAALQDRVAALERGSRRGRPRTPRRPGRERD
jgi:hypothetical protein